MNTSNSKEKQEELQTHEKKTPRNDYNFQKGEYSRTQPRNNHANYSSNQSNELQNYAYYMPEGIPITEHCYSPYYPYRPMHVNVASGWHYDNFCHSQNRRTFNYSAETSKKDDAQMTFGQDLSQHYGLLDRPRPNEGLANMANQQLPKTQEYYHSNISALKQQDAYYGRQQRWRDYDGEEYEARNDRRDGYYESRNKKYKRNNGNGNKNKIPDRWEKYSKIGTAIEGTSIIAMKVPLKNSLNNRLKETEQFGCNDVLELIHKSGHKLGKVINLCNTARYYLPSDFLSLDVEYKHLTVPGHVIPKESIVLDFYDELLKFESNDSNHNKLIAVHCTHGLNRTGYMICRYLIEHKHLDPEAAMQLFNDSRGHCIERQNYVDDLNQRKPIAPSN